MSQRTANGNEQPSAADILHGGPESWVTFQAGDGLEVRGTLLRLTRHAVAFEIFNPDAALRVSEVFNGFKIIIGGRTVFFGRAVVSGLVNTGTTLVAEAKLSAPETESAFFLPPAKLSPSAQEAYDRFFQQWQKEYRIAPEFKVLVADIGAFLTGIRQWLEQIEFTLKESKDRQQVEQEREMLDAVAHRVITAFNVQHERFEELAYQIPPELYGAHQDFVRRHWHKLFLCAPFGHRTFHKPLGYAGDYEMMNMIHRNQPEGRTLYEKLIHLLLVSQWPAESVRNRIAHLKKNLVSETARVARSGKRARILNIGCGPAWEMQAFMKESALSHEADFTLLDFNQETLDYASGELNELKRRLGCRAKISTMNISVHQLLRRAVRQGNFGMDGNYDLIYCAGLFDYLSEDTCRELVKLFDHNLLPGGLAVVANMNDCKPFRNFIEFVLDWQLIYRAGHEVQRFAPEHAAERAMVIAEPASVNLFLHLRKPD
ncbi:MAG TPA: class I SAM-dependent methyltransferase [Verrucomicrobiae bacterium]|jgi:extracellular factor (EF) 3-hydroxypalmitic acid methyl ester biosynthesis protein